jgi:hypothetical protein
MKIRIDYVSNSSSSSFMVVGHAFDNEELVKIAEHLNLVSEYHDNSDDTPEDYSEWDTGEIVEELEERFTDLDFQYGLENYYDNVCIGMEYDKMKDSETKKDFEKRIEDRLKEMTGKKTIKVECLIDGGMEG